MKKILNKHGLHRLLRKEKEMKIVRAENSNIRVLIFKKMSIDLILKYSTPIGRIKKERKIFNITSKKFAFPGDDFLGKGEVVDEMWNRYYLNDEKLSICNNHFPRKLFKQKKNFWQSRRHSERKREFFIAIGNNHDQLINF